ncbi:MAG: right-handed parallel beta-helix repeat-containing protein, partial [Acidimicrobiia bacterium]
MGDGHITPDDLNRAGRRAEARKARIRKVGAAFAAVPAALGTTALILGATAAPAGATTLTVLNLDPSGAGSLHDLAEGAADGDVIVFDSSLSGTIYLDDEINISESITIQGPGAGVVTVSGDTGNNGSADVQIFDINGTTANEDVVISGLTLTNGIATNGGAIEFDDANLTIRDSILTANSATSDGGAIASDDNDLTLTIETTEISGNTADDQGGGIYFYVAAGTFVMTNSQLTDNLSDETGGGAVISAEGGTDKILAVTITGSTITGNTSTENDGGGLYVNYVDGAVTITDTVISGNAAGGGGGGLWVYYASDVVVSNSTISDNSADGDGGGLYLGRVRSSATITFTTISGNTALEDGGGILWYDSDTLEIRNTTISGNSAAVDGGGLYIASSNDGPITIFNTTISGNTADHGGGISTASYEGLEIVQSTITDNTADVGAGLNIFTFSQHQAAAETAKGADRQAERDAARAAEGKDPAPVNERGAQDDSHASAELPVVVTGTIIAGNDGPGTDIGEEGALEATSSLLGTITGTTLVNNGGNLLGVDPLLGALGDNGGATATQALLPGSPAIDAGPNPLTPFPGSGN